MQKWNYRRTNNQNETGKTKGTLILFCHALPIKNGRLRKTARQYNKTGSLKAQHADIENRLMQKILIQRWKIHCNLY